MYSWPANDGQGAEHEGVLAHGLHRLGEVGRHEPPPQLRVGLHGSDFEVRVIRHQPRATDLMEGLIDRDEYTPSSATTVREWQVEEQFGTGTPEGKIHLYNQQCRHRPDQLGPR